MNDGIIRIGKVFDVNPVSRKARVRFDDIGVTSDWLPVLSNTPEVKVTIDGTEYIASVTPWLPKINDNVLCLYRPVFNGDGFVLGAI